MQLNCEQFEQMVLLLKHFGLACELPTVTSNLGSPTVTSSPSPLLLVPWFLTQECNQEVRDDWPDIPDESQVTGLSYVELRKPVNHKLQLHCII